MALKFRCLFFFLILFSSHAFAQDKASLLPEPMSLEANWWSFFEPVNSLEKLELDSRIEKVHVHIETLLKNLKSNQAIGLESQVKILHKNLRQFSDLKQSKPASLTVLLSAAETYTTEQASERYMLWRKLKYDMDTEQADLDWQNAQVSQARKRQVQRRNEYLELKATSPERFSYGLNLMTSRASLELLALQTARRNIYLKSITAQNLHLKDELANIHKRLIASDKGAKKWLIESSKAKAQSTNLRLQNKISVAGQITDSFMDSAKIKYTILKNSAVEIEISIYDLVATRYQLMYQLENYLQRPEPRSDRMTEESLADALKKAIQLKHKITEQQLSWRSLNEQSRKFAAAQTFKTESMLPVASKLYADLLKQVDENNRKLHDLDLEQGVNEFLVGILQEKIQDDASWYNQWWLIAQSSVGQSWSQISYLINVSLFEVNESPVTTLGLLRVLFIIYMALLLSKVIRKGLIKVGRKKGGVSDSSLHTLGQVIHYIVLIVGVMVGLSSIGLDFTKFALFASALGIGIGFGLQTLISNFVAGLIILFERSLKVGDFVELSTGLSGEVREINIRSTLITTNDNVDILVPNSEFVNSQVTNWTMRDTQRRIHVPFGVAYGTDKELVRKAVLEAAKEVTWTLLNDANKQPQVWFVEFGDSSLNFELVVWLKPEAVKRPSAVQAAYLWEIETKFKKYSIEIPFPQRDLHLRSVFGRKDDAGLLLLNKNKEKNESENSDN